MRTIIFLTSRNGAYDAKALFEDGKITIQPGARIRLDFADHIRGGRKALSYRKNPEYVNEKGVVLKECVFTSASTAAQFVTGRSTNGLDVWKVEKKLTLKQWLEQNM